jgi:hypothetical protein
VYDLRFGVYGEGSVRHGYGVGCRVRGLFLVERWIWGVVCKCWVVGFTFQSLGIKI